MATNVGDLVVQLSADSSRLTSELNKITGAGGPLARIGMAAAAAAAAAGAALAGLAVKGLADFQKLDQGMREVFTLLPGASQEAMDAMTEDVLAFSVETGKLTDDVVPALYQALSAGVPQDNVFDFLRTANELAIGGVADLESSVTVLSQVMNAYGEDMVTYEAASDALFTAVKLGVTTIPELAANIGKILPVSADLGVNFDHVAAMLATLTKVFPSTAEAATGLRAMLSELGKEGAIAFDVFKSATGMTFPEFIAGGGTVEEALAELQGAADASGQRMGDMFGSIEAGMAATVLAGDEGSEQLRAALLAMDDKAGATRAAFDTMDAGIQASWNRLIAGFSVLSTEVGQKLAPMFQVGVDWVVNVGMPALRDTVLAVFDAIIRISQDLTAAWGTWESDTDGVMGRVIALAKGLGAALSAVFEALAALWTNVLWPVWQLIEPAVSAAFAVVLTVITGALEVLETVMRAFTAFLNGDFTGGWDLMNEAVQGVNEALKTALEVVWNGVKQVLEGIWGGIAYLADAIWLTLRQNVETRMEEARVSLEAIWSGIRDWLSTLWDGIVVTAGATWDAVVAAIRGAFDGLAGTLTGIFDEVLGSITGMIDGVVGRIADAWDRVTALFDRSGAAEARAAEAAASTAAALAAAEAAAAAAGSVAAGGQGSGGTGGSGGRPTPPRFATGGIVTGPMRAIVGEAGPEAILPLDRLDSLLGRNTGGDTTLIVELDGGVIMRAIAPRLINDLRLRTGVSGL